MKWAAPILINLLFSFTCPVQATEMDSLTSTLNSIKNDTERIDLLVIMAQKYWYINPDTAYQIAEQAYELSSEKGYTRRKAAAANGMAAACHVRSDYGGAIRHWTEALDICTEIGDTSGIARSTGNIGLVYDMQGDYAKALEFYYGSLKMREQLGDKTNIAIQLANIAIVHQRQKEHEKALDIYFKSLEVLEEIGNQSIASTVLGNIGVIYWLDKEFEHSHKFFNRALEAAVSTGNIVGQAHALQNIGGVYQDEKEYDKALEYFRKSKELNQKLGVQTELSTSYGNLGSLQVILGDYAQSERNLDSAMQLAREINSIDLQQNWHFAFSELYEKTREFDKSLSHFKQYTSLKDSLFNEGKSKDIGKLEAKYEFEKNEAERKRKKEEALALLAAQELRRNNLQYSGILIFLVFIFAAVFALGRFSIPIRLAEGMIFFSFLLFFEFTLVLLDPYIEEFSSGAPVIKLMFNAVLAAMIFPLHAFFESKMKTRLSR